MNVHVSEHVRGGACAGDETAACFASTVLSLSLSLSLSLALVAITLSLASRHTLSIRALSWSLGPSCSAILFSSSPPPRPLPQYLIFTQRDGKHALDRLISVTASGLQFVGVPQCVEDDEYKRNELSFNVCFVFHQSARHVDDYHHLVRKLSTYVRTLEVESGFLSDPITKTRLGPILAQVLHDLNTCHLSIISVDNANTIALKLARHRPTPPAVSDHDVPICVIDLDQYERRHRDGRRGWLGRWGDGCARGKGGVLRAVCSCIQHCVEGVRGSRHSARHATVIYKGF